jgi:hypothetical protein
MEALENVTLCVTLFAQVHVTLAPGATRMAAGSKAKPAVSDTDVVATGVVPPVFPPVFPPVPGPVGSSPPHAVSATRNSATNGRAPLLTLERFISTSSGESWAINVP